MQRHMSLDRARVLLLPATFSASSRDRRRGWKTGRMSTTVGSEHFGRGVGARVGAVAVALFWAVPFFGIVDLTVLIPPAGGDFYDFYLIESGWGLLFTFLAGSADRVGGPAAGVERPAGRRDRGVDPGHRRGRSRTGTGGRGVVGRGVGGVSADVAAATEVVGRPRAHRPALWPLDALVAIAVGCGAVYAWDMVDAAYGGAPDDNTNGLMHLPMQAGFGLGLAASAVVAVLALANGVAGCWLAFVPAAVSAVWLGVVSNAYPHHLGSIGELGGMLAIGWGVLLLVVAWGTGLLLVPAGRAAEPPVGDR